MTFENMALTEKKSTKVDMLLTDFVIGVITQIRYYREFKTSSLSMKLTYGAKYTVNLKRKKAMGWAEKVDH